MRLNNPEFVRRQYETEAGLAVRREAITSFLDGPNAFDTAFEAVVEVRPQRVLEVGCGMGQFAERLVGKLAVEVVAIDLSPRMVELARDRGVDARVADVQALPFKDGEFDCVVANWMLYHVADLDRALAELARVLAPAGRLVAATVGEEHQAEVWHLVGFTPPPRPFSRENGEGVLRRRFDRVERRDVDSALVFPNATAVHEYVESTIFGDLVPRPLPEFEGSLRSRLATTVFMAQK